MVKKFITITTLALLTLGATAQNYNVIEEVKGDWIKASGMEAPYTMPDQALTPAPEGYTPVYVSHYGRHGSRYAYNDDTYKLIHKALSKAHKDGNLTALGESFYERYEKFYKIPLTNTGDLVPLGVAQHKAIAAYIYNAFPEVFAGERKVSARSSTSGRCIVSMSAFCTSLQKQNPGLDISLSCNHMGMCDIVPPSAPSAYRKEFEAWGDQTRELEGYAEFFERTVDYDAILGKIFKDYDFLKDYEDGIIGFFHEFYEFLGNYQNYEDVNLFKDLVTADEMAQMWESNNYFSFVIDYEARFGTIPLLHDIISKADEALGENGNAADLRFGHDYIVEAFTCLINANGCGTVPETAEEAKYWFQSFNVPMAANLQFVLYRSEKGKDILFKLLWNGKEAQLPDLYPVSGPYYKWNDFKDFAEGIFKAHPEK